MRELTEAARLSQSVSGTVRRGALDDVVGTDAVAWADREEGIVAAAAAVVEEEDEWLVEDLRGGMAFGGEEGKEGLFEGSEGLVPGSLVGELSLGTPIVKGSLFAKADRKMRGFLWVAAPGSGTAAVAAAAETAVASTTGRSSAELAWWVAWWSSFPRWAAEEVGSVVVVVVVVVVVSRRWLCCSLLVSSCQRHHSVHPSLWAAVFSRTPVGGLICWEVGISACPRMHVSFLLLGNAVFVRLHGVLWQG